jgi:hypothetical protein
MKRFLLVAIPALAVLAGLYLLVVFNWNYSTGERAGWVQKLSKKGWLCKTWEGELAMVSMPGAMPEKFYFTVRDDAVAERINRLMGRRVALHYEEKVGIPTTCFGETRHWVNRVDALEDIPLVPGVVVPVAPPAARGAGGAEGSAAAPRPAQSAPAGAVPADPRPETPADPASPPRQ